MINSGYRVGEDFKEVMSCWQSSGSHSPREQTKQSLPDGVNKSHLKPTDDSKPLASDRTAPEDTK